MFSRVVRSFGGGVFTLFMRTGRLFFCAAQKTEAEALQALETETANLEKEINKEIKARAKYVQNATDWNNQNPGDKVEIVLRLLRRIVVMGVTKADVESLKQEWLKLKKDVEQVEQKIKNLIAELKNMESETAKQAAQTAETNVKAVTDAVNEVRKAKTTAAIDTIKTNKVDTAVKTAKTEVKQAKETVQNKEEAKKAAGLLRRGDLLYNLVERTETDEYIGIRKIGGPWYKLAAGAPVKLAKALLTQFYPLNGLTDYVVAFPHSSYTRIPIYVRRKSGGTPTLVKKLLNVDSSPKFKYAGGYVYYRVTFKENSKYRTEFWRFRPEQQPPKAEKLGEMRSNNGFDREFAADAIGNILAISQGDVGISGSQHYAKFFKKGDKTGITPKIGGSPPDFSGGTEYKLYALNGKIYLLQLKSGTVKAFAVDQNGNATPVVGASALVPASSNGLAIYTVKSIYAQANTTDKNTITWHVLRFDGNSLSEVTLPQENGNSKKVLQNSNGDVLSFRKGQQALYNIFASSSDAKKGEGVYRAQVNATSFESAPIFAAAANKLENIYKFAVLPGNPDKIAIAAKTKIETKNGKTTGGKHVVIELDANSKKELRRSPELDKEIKRVYFWR